MRDFTDPVPHCLLIMTLMENNHHLSRKIKIKTEVSKDSEGRWHGLYVSRYVNNGRLASAGFYEHGMPVGEHIQFDRAGNIKCWLVITIDNKSGFAFAHDACKLTSEVEKILFLLEYPESRFLPAEYTYHRKDS